MQADFLDGYAADIQAVYAYWLRKRGLRAMPHPSDIDFVDLWPYLSGLAFVDVVDDHRRYVYRLLGAHEIIAHGGDPGAWPVFDRFFGDSLIAALRNYDAVRDRRAPILNGKGLITPDGHIDNEQELLLPLSACGADVSSILVYVCRPAGTLGFDGSLRNSG